jgi:integrase/recombinase XerC
MIKRTGTRAVGDVPCDPAEFPAGVAPLTPSQTLGQVLQEFKEARLTDQSSHRMTELLVRFTIFLDKGLRLGSVEEISAEHVSQFIRAGISTPTGRQSPSVATMHLRRSALRLYFRTLRQLGLYDGDPTIDVALPPRSCLSVRPLTDDEIVVCRSFSLQTLTATRQPAAWALAEATARTSEIPHILVSDLDLTNGRGGSTGAPRRSLGGAA